MRLTSSITLMVATLFVLGCPMMPGSGNGDGNGDGGNGNIGLMFSADLSGEAEVPPVETDASGTVEFEVIEGGLSFTLTVMNGTGVTQAHIHIGGADENGPVAVFLFGPVGGGQDVNGELSSGVITDEDLVGPLEGMNLDALIAELEAGNAYVNVHTLANPSGEIRGQIE